MKRSNCGSIFYGKWRNKGFFLVETLIALLILVVALLALSQLPIVTTRLISLSIDNEKAMLIAKEKLEELEGASFDASSLSAGDHSGYSDGRFDVSWFVSETSVLKDVLVKVRWNPIVGSGSVEMRRQVSSIARDTAAEE